MKDLISRDAAIAYAISGRTREIDGEKWIRVSEVRESLQTIPSAEKTGRWIVYTSEAWSNWEIAKCSVCGYENVAVEVFDLDGYHYCPNCGARMEVEHEIN